MQAFLDHFKSCEECKEYDELLSLCNRGNAFYSGWASEVRIRYQEGIAETDIERIKLSLRFFGKNSQDGVILPKQTAMALYRYLSKLDDFKVNA